MSTSPNDPNAPESKPELDSIPVEQNAAKPAIRRGPATLAGKALPYLAALAAAGATQAGATAPAAEPDRAYLEALLHGSWTQPPDLSAQKPAPGTAADPAAGEVGAVADSGFNDSFNPHPKPYSDRSYADSGFGDRSR